MDISPQARLVKSQGKIENLENTLKTYIGMGKNAQILKQVVCTENAPSWSKKVSSQFWQKVASLDAKKLALFLSDDSLVGLKAAITRMMHNAAVDAELALVDIKGATLTGLHKKIEMPNEFYYGQMPVWTELESAAVIKRVKMTPEQVELCRGLAITGAVVDKLYPVVEPEEIAEEIAAVV